MGGCAINFGEAGGPVFVGCVIATTATAIMGFGFYQVRARRAVALLPPEAASPPRPR